MSAKSNIGWTDSTASPWFGCTEVSHGCANCYARELTLQKFAFVHKSGDPEKSGVMRRAYYRAGLRDWATRPAWGKNATRVLSKSFYTEPFKWNRQCVCNCCDQRMDNHVAGEHRHGTVIPSFRRVRVFPSMIDWLDDFPEGVVDQDGAVLTRREALARFLWVVAETTNIEWLLLTKRIDAFHQAMADVQNGASFGRGERLIAMNWALSVSVPPHVRLGVSVENQREADERIPDLLRTPASSRFLSVEPLLEGVDITSRPFNVSGGYSEDKMPGIDWVIVGAESGPQRRDCGVGAIVSVHNQCVAAGVLVFVKQDCALHPGQQGRIPDAVWARKEFPE